MTAEPGFRHEALLYADDDHLATSTSAFLRDGLAAGEAALVVVETRRIALLRAALGDDADAVRFVDMANVGRNPARIIPLWRRFLDEHDGVGRGVGEPVWPGRSPAELVECRVHEALLDVAFADSPGFHLLCPYDTGRLDPAVVDQARATHDGVDARRLLAEPLDPPAGAGARRLTFTRLWPVRRFVGDLAVAAGIDPAGVADVVLALDEVAANSLRHGGGRGTVAVWTEPGALVCEVTDRGCLRDPLAGRRAPVDGQLNGRGLWMANQLCRLLQLRTSAWGTTVRLHFSR